jgi:ketosteroid isomerase-like protein
MSEDNVATIRRMYEAWLAGDTEVVYETFDPALRVNPDPEASWVGVDDVYIGHEGMARYMRSVYEAFEDYRPEVERILDLDDERVLTLAVEHGRGRGSGAEVQANKTAHLWTLRDGKATRLDLFLDRARAFEAVGLSEKLA